MNKNDIKLIIIVLLIVFSIFLIFKFSKNENNNYAFVYYENKEILKIDLNEDKNYEVKGYNGKIKIVVKNKKIKVDSEKSPLNLCSKQGYISRSYETIICLPNKITIKIDSVNDIDTIVK